MLGSQSSLIYGDQSQVHHNQPHYYPQEQHLQTQPSSKALQPKEPAYLAKDPTKAEVWGSKYVSKLQVANALKQSQFYSDDVIINKDLTEQEKVEAEKFAETMLTNESLEQAHTQDFEEEDDEANRLLFERGRRGAEREDEDGDKSDDSDDESY